MRTRRVTDHCVPEGSAHLLFGSVEELLADLAASGGPEGGIVRVERLVRTQPTALGGTAIFGVTITARRANELSEVLSAWVIIARVTLDLRGQAISTPQAQDAARQHHETQRLISALVADAGYAPRSGVYLLSDGCYSFTATAEPLATSRQHTEPTPTHPDASRDAAIEPEVRSEGGGSDA
ncbi:MAG: hypothetical protein ACRDID_09395 [Ktedonobacterales bacterium]